MRRAGLVYSRQGVAGTRLTRALSEITLQDVYQAVEPDRDLFSVHANPSSDRAVGSNIATTLNHIFGGAQRAMEEQLGKTTLADIVEDLKSTSH